MGTLSDILKMKLETLLGERGPSANAAVRRGELDALMSKAAIASMSKAGTSVNAQVAEALRIAKRAEAAVAALQASQTSAESETADDTAQNERLSQVLSSLFTWNGGTYSLRIPAQGINGTILEEQIADEAISLAKFATNLRPVEIVSSLPTTDNFDGRHVYRTTDKSLWRFNGTAWVNTNAADQIVGKLVAGQIEVGAVGADQLAVHAVQAKHMVITDWSNIWPDSDLSDTSNWVVGAGGWQIVTAEWFQMRGNKAVQASGSHTAPAGETLIGVFSPTGRVPVEAGRPYYLAACIDPNTGATGTISINLQWIAADNSVIATDFINGNTASAARQDVRGTFTAPAGAVYARPYVRRGTSTAGGTATGTIYVGDLSMRRADGGDLTVDGSLKARHMATELILTDAAQIGVAVVNEAAIQNAAVGTLKIGNQAVSADWNSHTAGWAAFSGYSQGIVQSITISDSTVNGCVAWVTFSASVELQRSTAGRAIGFVELLINGVVFATNALMHNVPAGLAIENPFSLTRRVVLPSSGPNTISASVGNIEESGSGNTTRMRYRRLEINVMKR